MGTVVISPGDGHALSKENVKHLPASLTRAMADAVVAAAVEMEVCLSVRSCVFVCLFFCLLRWWFGIGAEVDLIP